MMIVVLLVVALVVDATNFITASDASKEVFEIATLLKDASFLDASDDKILIILEN